ncbi:MAG: DUF6544 family protein [Candidatus Eisenbacteria bacterium]
MWSRIGLVVGVAVLLVAAAAVRCTLQLRAAHDRAVAARRGTGRALALLTEDELAPLPAAVQRYLRNCGVVGQPHVIDFHVRFRGRIRSGPDAPWMPFTGVQDNFIAPLERDFLMNATLFGIPLVAVHRYAGEHATMRVRLLGLFPVVDAAGPVMDQAETVTLFNDMCLLAPAMLVDAAIEWGTADSGQVQARFTNAGHTIAATLQFDDAGDLVDFISDERFMSNANGRTFTRCRWSTPVSGFRTYGPVRLFATAEARWHPPSGEFVYLEFEPLAVSYNGGRPAL